MADKLVPIVAMTAASALGSMVQNSARNSDRLESRLDGYYQSQMGHNTTMASLVSGQGSQLSRLQSDQNALFSCTDQLRDQLGETNLRMGRYESDASNLVRNQDRFDNRLNLMHSEQNTLNMDLVRRNAELGENYNQFRENQLSVNSEFKMATAGIQKMLDETSTGLEVVKSRADCMKQDVDRIGSEVARYDGKLDNFQAGQNQFNLNLTDKYARIEEQQKMMAGQQGLLLTQQEAIMGKQNETDTTLKLVIDRTDSLIDGQKRIYSDIREDRKIIEDRLRDQTTYTQTLSDRNTAVEQRQNCFIEQQKTTNDQIINRTEHVREKLGETSTKAELINFRVEKIENEQKDKDKQYQEMAGKVNVLERYGQDYRDELKQMRELVERLVVQIAAIDERSKMMQNQLDALQAGFDRVRCGHSEEPMGHSNPFGNHDCRSMHKMTRN